MATRIHDVDDDSLLHILRKVVSDNPTYVEDALLVCKRFRNVLLSDATAVTITCDNPALLQHCHALCSMFLSGCSRLPWDVHLQHGVPCCAPSHLSQISALTSIDAHDAHVSDTEMAKLRCLPDLEELRVSRGVSGAGLEELCSMTSLSYLQLSGCRELVAGSLEHLSNLTFLELLDLDDVCLPTADFVAHITGLNALYSLDLSEAITGSCASLHHLSALHGLEFLDLSWNSELLSDDLGFLSALTRLETLCLDGCSTENQGN